MESQPQRMSRTALITIRTDVEKAFPLFGPLREREWAQGWEPRVMSEEEGTLERMVFVTEGHPPFEEQFLWIVTRYRPEEYQIEYAVSTQGRVWFIAIVCSPISKAKTKAQITYTYIALSELGARLNREALTGIFRHDLGDWEAAINHYLATGERLAHH